MTDLRSQQRVEPLRQLLPCPLCGEKRIFLNEPSQWHRYGSINCPACLLVLPGEVNDKKELINCWNERAPLASQDVPSAISSPTQSMDIWQAYAAAQDEIAALKRERAAVIEECAKVAEAVQYRMREECDFGAGIAAKEIRALSQAPVADGAPDPLMGRIALLEAALKEIRSNANCHDKEVVIATMPLIFQTATRAIRGDSI